jgi:hypothetical protein
MFFEKHVCQLEQIRLLQNRRILYECQLCHCIRVGLPSRATVGPIVGR